MAEAYYAWNRAEERSLARFVREELPPALRLPAYINRLDLLARKGPVGLMEQLYSVLRDQGIRYDLALFDPHPGITQRIRKPETILAE